MQSEERNHRGGWAIAKGDPDHLRGSTACHAKSEEILVAGYEHTCIVDGERPYRMIMSPSSSQLTNVQRKRIEVLQSGDQGFGEILVEEKPHARLRSGDR